ncbi:unnamed protein product [Rhizopus stolonifer]
MVIDYKHQATYAWSVERFASHLYHLQGINFVTDYKEYLKGDGLFYNLNISSCVLVDLAKVLLQNLATQIPVESQVSVHCRSTDRLMCKPTISIAPIARSVRIPTRSYRIDDGTFKSDEETPRDLLHIPSSFLAKNLNAVFSSYSMKNSKKDTAIEFDYYQTLSMVATEAMSSNIVFIVYDTQKSEGSVIIPPKRPQDVLTCVQVCELTPKGDYKPSPIECSEPNSIFPLKQDQQQLLMLSLERIVEVKLDQVQMDNAKIIDYKHNSQASETDYHILKAKYSWDSSLHNTFFLNVSTSIVPKILLTLNFIVCNQSQGKVKFVQEIAVNVKDHNKALRMTKKKKKSANSQVKRDPAIIFSLKTGHAKNHMPSIYVVDCHA